MGVGLEELFVRKGRSVFGCGSLIIKFAEPVFAREALAQVKLCVFA